MKTKIIKLFAVLALVTGVTSPALADEKAKTSDAAKKAADAPKDAMSVWMDVAKKMHQNKGGFTPNTFMGNVDPEAKRQIMQSLMSMSPLGLRDIMGMMATKIQVQDGVSFDDVIESMKTRANAVNMKLVGHNVPYKLLRQIHDPKSPRLEILSFCDMVTMRMIVDYVPEFVIFLPCKITVLEDAKGKIWLTTLDWSVEWLRDKDNKVKFLPDDLVKRAIKVRKALDSIMQAGAEGDF